MAIFEYNSQRSKLAIPEYGRHIQYMIGYAKKIEDPAKRQRTANAIIELMNQMVPQARHVENYKDKLWKHFFRIADFDIDVVDHKGVKPDRTEVYVKPESLPYSQSKISYRHYGKNITSMIEKAIEMEDGAKKEGFVHIIAAYMKLAYRNWNRDHYVSDDNIQSDIKMISEGKLSLPDNTNLDILAAPSPLEQSPSRGKKRRGPNKSRGRTNSYKKRKR